MRALAWVGSALGLWMGLVLLGVRRHHLRDTPGMLLWAWAPLLCAAGCLAYAAWGQWPAALVVTLANGLVLGAAALYVLGAQRFFGQPLQLAALAGWVSACLVLIQLAHQLWPQARAEALLLLLGAAGLSWALQRLWQGQRMGAAGRYLQGVQAAQAALLALCLAQLLWPSSLDVPHGAMFLALCATLLMMGLGVLLLASQRLREEFMQLARLDALTGSLTRTAWLEQAEMELARCRRYGHALSLLFFDLDSLKHINDQYGHRVGDRVLREAVQQARLTLRQSDQLGRLGGEEFAVLLPETEVASAMQVAERLRQAVEVGPGAPRTSISAGLVSLGAFEAIPGGLDELLSRADAALLRAKTLGRNRVELCAQEADPSPTSMPTALEGGLA
ncbi:diguanylate cyclase [Roseateles sp. BYS180W]|uniref:diguanylate cyclase n=1 Tax=Roseateles rivi TaxID=3299028 RepID=A0ABW7FTB3_9BURK